MALFLIFYQSFYACYYLRFEPYDNKKEIENIEKYFQKSFGKSKIYHKIKIFMISFLIIDLLFCFILRLKKKISLIFFFFFEFFIHLIFFIIDFLLLYDAYFNYENQKINSIILNLLLIDFFIFVHFILLLPFIIISIFVRYEKTKIFELEKFQGIKINTLRLDDNFYTMNSEEKKRYLLSKTKEMTFKNDQNEENIKKIRSTINKFRKENKLEYLIYVNKLPEFIINGNSLVKFTLNNIFKIGNKKYLFKYPSGDFLKLLNEKNQKILSILSLDYLKKIKIVTKEDNEYILVYYDKKDEFIQVGTDNLISEKENLNSKKEFKIDLKNIK